MRPYKHADPRSFDPNAPRQKLQIKNLLDLLRLTRDYKKEYVLMLLFLILQIASYQALTYSLKYLINDLFPQRRVSYLLIYAACWIFIFFLHALVTVTAARFRVVIVRSLTANIRAELIAKMQVLSMKYFDQRGTGATSAKILMDVDRTQGFFDWLLAGFLNAVIAIICIIPFLSAIDPMLTLITFLYIPTIPLVQRLFWKTMMTRSYTLRNTAARFSEKMIDYIQGIRLIRTFAAEDEQGARIMNEVHAVKTIDIRYSMIMRNFQMVIQFFGDFMPVMLWIVAGIIIILSDNLTLGAVVAYIGLVTKLLNSVQTLFSSFDQIVAASPSVTALMEILQNDQVENPHPAIRKFAIDGSISMDRVNFSYETRQGRLQLADVSFSIAAGEKIALVGESGSGKTTLVNVLMGFYPVRSGVVKFGQYDLSQVSLKHLRSQIAVMSQETFLFNTTLMENIRFARLSATDEEIVQACRMAQIHDFIDSLPEKYETCAGERGTTISGGQRQRIGLARVFLRKPRIVILDEPTSSLDIFTEQRLFDTLYANIRGVTLIVIAHRLSTIRNVDRVFVFQEGRIIEQGRFDDLARGNGMFADMVRANAVTLLEEAG